MCVLLFPGVEGGLTDAQLPTEVANRGPTLGLPDGIEDLPKKAQPKASEWLKVMPYAETKAECERRRDGFVRTYQGRRAPRSTRLLRDWDRMVTFYSFPGALASSADDEHRGIPLRLGAAPHGRLPPVQARGGSQGDHLEDAPDRRDGS